jgi:hypothetical protein
MQVRAYFPLFMQVRALTFGALRVPLRIKPQVGKNGV